MYRNSVVRRLRRSLLSRVRRGVTPAAYADDLALVITGKDKSELEKKANEVIERVGKCMQEKELQLAPQEIEALLLIGGRDLHGNFTCSIEDTMLS